MLYAQGNVIPIEFYMCTDNLKVKLFKSICSSMNTCQIWWNYNKYTMRNLIVDYNTSFRMLLSLPRDCSASGMLASNTVLSCSALIRKLTFGFCRRLDNSKNEIIGSILSSDIKWTSKIRLRRHELLPSMINSMT